MSDDQGSFWTSGLAESIGITDNAASSIEGILSGNAADTATDRTDDASSVPDDHDVMIAKLQALLADDDILQECQSGNAMLADFLSGRDTIAAMIAYMLDPKFVADVVWHPGFTSDEQVLIGRYGYMSSEIFMCEIAAPMLDTISANPDLLTSLFAFIQAPSVTGPDQPRLDSRRAGYFRKFMTVLIQKRYSVVVEYISTHAQVLTNLLSYIDNTSILECIIMLGWDDGAKADVPDDRKWLFDMRFIPLLIDRFAGSCSPATTVNAAHALVDMLLKCPNNTSTILIDNLSTPSVIQALVTHITSGSPWSYTAGLSVLTVLLQRYAVSNAEFQDVSFEWDLPYPITYIVSRLEIILSCSVQLSSDTTPRACQWGVLEVPLTNVRLRTAELCLGLIRISHSSINEKIVQLHVIPMLVDWFFKYTWNNLLHFVFEASAASILSPANDMSLKQSLLEESSFVSRSMDLVKQETNRDRYSPRAGQLGHIIRILCVISKLQEQGIIVQSVWIHPEIAVWDTFKDTLLANEIARYEIQLGGSKPDRNALSAPNDEEDAALLKPNADDDWNKPNLYVSTFEADFEPDHHDLSGYSPSMDALNGEDWSSAAFDTAHFDDGFNFDPVFPDFPTDQNDPFQLHSDVLLSTNGHHNDADPLEVELDDVDHDGDGIDNNQSQD